MNIIVYMYIERDLVRYISIYSLFDCVCRRLHMKISQLFFNPEMFISNYSMYLYVFRNHPDLVGDSF